MAITTFTELKTAISNWLIRSNLATRDEEFIVLAEANINSNLRIREMETSVSFASVIGTNDYGIKANIPRMMEIREVKLAITPKKTLDYLAPDVLTDLWEGDANGVPRAYTLSGDNFRIAPAPDSTNAQNLTIVYYKQQDIATDTTSDLLSRHSDIYLYGSLLQAVPFLKEDNRVALWRELYEAAVIAATGGDLRGMHHGGNQDSNSE